MAHPPPEPARPPDSALLAALAGLSALGQQALDLVCSRRYTQREPAEILSTSHNVGADAMSRTLQSLASVMDTFDRATPRT